MIVIYIDRALSIYQIDKLISLSYSDVIVLVGDLTYIPKDLHKFYTKIYSSDYDIFDKLLLLGGKSIYNKDFNKFLSNLFSVKIISVGWLTEDGLISDGTENSMADTLFVFPGSIVPISIGSHQRSFNLLLNLAASGYTVDVLIPDNPRLDKEKIKLSLKCVCNRVYFYKDRRKKFTKKQTFKRGIEKRIRQHILGKSSDLPDFFSERLQKKPTESLKRWVNSLYLANGYENIVVSYAWMLPAIHYIKHLGHNYNLICDTHDVQFYRNENILSKKERLFFNKSKEKDLEVSWLNQCDAVIAISEIDKEILSKNLKANVISIYPGFDYAEAPIKQRPVGRPVHFGFIGGGMKANVQALGFIFEHWWPVIKKHSPDSMLYIAGSVCNNPIIKEQSFFDKNIVLLGFVKDISEFYTKIEVALNPVVITGGLNFKSVEAVCAGKHLFTNTIGMKCLTHDFPCKVIDEPDELIEAINDIEFNLKQDKQNRFNNQKKALKIFGDYKIQKSLLNFFN